MSEEKKLQIRFRTLPNGGVYAHNGECCGVFPNKGVAIKVIKEKYPGDYEIINISEEYREKRSNKEETNTPTA